MRRRDEKQIVGWNGIAMKVSFREHRSRGAMVCRCDAVVSGSKEVDRIKVLHVETTNNTPSSRGKAGFRSVEVSFSSMIRNELDAHGCKIEQ